MHTHQFPHLLHRPKPKSYGLCIFPGIPCLATTGQPIRARRMNDIDIDISHVPYHELPPPLIPIYHQRFHLMNGYTALVVQPVVNDLNQRMTETTIEQASGVEQLREENTRNGTVECTESGRKKIARSCDGESAVEGEEAIEQTKQDQSVVMETATSQKHEVDITMNDDLKQEVAYGWNVLWVWLFSFFWAR